MTAWEDKTIDNPFILNNLEYKILKNLKLKNEIQPNIKYV